jgi:predicted nucleotidyltransferase
MYKNENMENAARIMKAYTDDYINGLHVREIAKTVKISPSAASYMTRNLEKQRILDYRIEGRNKKYFINFANPVARDMMVAAELLKKTEIMEKYFIIKKMVNETDFQNSIVLLFGSFAKGTSNEESDIDILILDRNISLKKKLKKFGDLYKKATQIISMRKKNFMIDKKKEFIIEILRGHIVLNGTEEFVNMLWRIYHAT